MKNIKLIFFLLSLWFSLSANAQVTQQWVSAFNGTADDADEVIAMEIDVAGNVYSGGITTGTNTDEDFTVVKYNSAGLQQWQATYGTPGSIYDHLRDIAVDNNGNVYVAGVSLFDEFNSIIVTIKYNSNGIQQWVRTYGGEDAPAYINGYNHSIALDNAGNLYVGGSSKTDLSDNGGYRLIKYNAAGDTLWTRRYKGTSNQITHIAYIMCIRTDINNNIYVTGSSHDANDHNYSGTVKYDAAGNVIWINKYGLQGNSNQPQDMVVDEQGNAYVIIDRYDPLTGVDCASIKISSTGDLMWDKIYNGTTGNLSDHPVAVGIDASKNVYVTGITTRQGDIDHMLTVKYNADGSFAWDRIYNSGNLDAYGLAIAVDGPGNCYVTGYTEYVSSGVDCTTLKYNTSGDVVWSENFNGTNNGPDLANVILLDAQNNVYVGGASEVTSQGLNFMTIKYSQTVGIQQVSNQIPSEFSLAQNYPNPFNPTTKIKFSISEQNIVSLKVYNINGSLAESIIEKFMTAGTYEVSFNGSSYPSGIYFYELNSGEHSVTRKMILAK